MRIRYGWELALAALLVIEIVAFGAINPRMLDLNMLLFSTSDFICIGIVALPLTMVIVSGGIDISFGSTIGLCAIALGVLFQSGVPMPLAILLTLLLGALCGLINAGLIIYTKRLARCICLPEALCCFPVWPERRGTKVLVDSRWRLQISLTWMCWDSPFR